MSIQGKNMMINGLNLNVVVEGEGEPVLLLHGFPDSNYVWRGVIPRLAEAGYQVIAPDQRGFGLSDAPEAVEERRERDRLILDSASTDRRKRRSKASGNRRQPLESAEEARIGEAGRRNPGV